MPSLKKTSLLLFLSSIGMFFGNGLRAEDIYFVKGLYYEYWKVEESAESSGLSVKSSFFNHSGGVSSLNPVFPDDPEQLAGFKLIILANVDAASLGFRGRQALEKAVREKGVKLLVFGEYLAFGGGGYIKTLVEKMLPVTVTGVYDLVRSPEPLPLMPVLSTPYEKLDWSAKPSVLWYHRLALRPDAEIIVKIGNDPFLVIHPYGTGKVGVITGTALGKENDPTTAFWKWKDFPRFMAETVNLLMKK